MTGHDHRVRHIRLPLRRRERHAHRPAKRRVADDRPDHPRCLHRREEGADHREREAELGVPLRPAASERRDQRRAQGRDHDDGEVLRVCRHLADAATSPSRRARSRTSGRAPAPPSRRRSTPTRPHPARPRRSSPPRPSAGRRTACGWCPTAPSRRRSCGSRSLPRRLRAAPGSPRGRGRPAGRASSAGTSTPAEPPVPGLLADGALDHLHVPVAPLLDALVDVDHPLADLGPGRVGAVDLDQAVAHLRRRGRPARPTYARNDSYRLGRSMAAVIRSRPGPRRVVGEHARVAPAEHRLELAELRRLEAARALEPAAEAPERERRHRLEDVDLRDDASSGSSGSASSPRAPWRSRRPRATAGGTPPRAAAP